MAITLQVQRLRERRGLSQAELARRSGIAQSTISRLEAGKLNALDFRKLERLAEVLGIAPAALFRAPGLRQTQRRLAKRGTRGRGR